MPPISTKTRCTQSLEPKNYAWLNGKQINAASQMDIKFGGQPHAAAFFLFILYLRVNAV